MNQQTEYMFTDNPIVAFHSYLITRMEDFQVSRYFYPYVLLFNKKVSYLVAKTVDNGDTVVTRAGRCNPKYAGMGVYKKLKKHMLDSSSASINAFTAVDANLSIRQETFRKSNTCILKKV